MTCQMSGDCCRIFYINLSKEEYQSKQYTTQFENFGYIDDYEIANQSGAAVLAKKDDGSCIYLADNKCSIHPRRPAVCRPFTCTSPDPQFADMINQVNKYRNKKT